MTPTLRPYQQQGIAAVRASIAKGHHAPLYVLPTGGGKTIMFADIARSGSALGNRILILVHRREIMAQTLQKLCALGVTAGQIATGKPRTADLVQVAMIQTLVRRLEWVRRPDVIVIDEAHHVLGENSHGRALSYWRDVPRIGFTATPSRMDGRGLRESFDDLIIGPSISELVTQGHLSYPVVYRPPQEQSADYHVKRGDFDVDEQQRAMSERRIVGDVIDHYRRHFNGAPAICFCVNVEHTRLMAAQFSNAGYLALPVYGDMADGDREEALDGLKEGRVQIITSCDLISEGFDTPAVAGVILLRRTMSLGLALQQIGRSLRPIYAEGYDLTTREGRLAAIAASIKPSAKILDHAGNYYLHGHVLADREWSLDSQRRDPRKVRPPVTTSCPKCYAVIPGTPRKCPYCGFAFAEAVTPRARDFGSIEGELVEALPGAAPEDVRQLAGFVAAALRMPPAQKQRAMMAKAFEALGLGDEGQRRLHALGQAVGYGPKWTRFAWQYAQKKRRG